MNPHHYHQNMKPTFKLQPFVSHHVRITCKLRFQFSTCSLTYLINRNLIKIPNGTIISTINKVALLIFFKFCWPLLFTHNICLQTFPCCKSISSFVTARSPLPYSKFPSVIFHSANVSRPVPSQSARTMHYVRHL